MINNNAMDFGPEMPQLEGTTWWKRDGKDHFTIRDVLMGPEGFSIRTTDGRMLNGDVMDTYIQSEVPINIPKQAPKQKIDVSHLDEVNGIDTNFGSLKYEHDVNFQKPQAPKHTQKVQQDTPKEMEGPKLSDSVELAMVDKVFGKFDDNTINVQLPCDEKIINSINTITNVLNVDKKFIIQYFERKLFKYVTQNSSKIVDEWINEITTQQENKQIINEQVNKDSE